MYATKIMKNNIFQVTENHFKRYFIKLTFMITEVAFNVILVYLSLRKVEISVPGQVALEGKKL